MYTVFTDGTHKFGYQGWDPKYVIGLICKQCSLMELVSSDTKDGTLNIL